MPNEIEDLYPLSPMQQGMLFDALLQSESALYFEQLSCTFEGRLDVAAFKAAWQRAVERHAILRTGFVWEDLKEPMQFVQREAVLPCAEQDWRGLTAAEQRERLRDYLRRDRERGVELTKAPLMRLSLLRTSEHSYAFVWSHHHLLLDGWSSALLLEEVLTVYRHSREGRSARLEPSRQYGDYIEWLQKEDRAEAESFWRRRLKGFTAPTPLGLDRAPSTRGEPSLGHSRQEATIPAAQTAQLDAFARRHRLTLSTVVQGAWALLLSRYSRQEDVVFGATVSSRPASLAGVETILGNFINTLPARVRVRPDAPLNRWLEELQEAQSEMRQFEYSSLVQIQGWSEVPRGLPLFESLLVFENYPTGSAFDASTWEESVGLSVSDVRTADLINFPLAVGVEPGPGTALTLAMVYDPRRFDHSVVAHLLGHLRETLAAFVRDPERPLKSLKFLTDDERRRTLLEWNDTRRAYPAYDSVTQLFEEQVRRTPDRLAVCFEGRCLTYAELDVRANQLAHRLRRMGVGPETPVALLLQRSLEMVVAIFGVLKAGGAYLPLDPSYPRERLVALLEESRAPVLLADGRSAGRLPGGGARVLCLDACADSLARESVEPPASRVTGGNLAYIIYTSGSTGKPKGVMNTHEGILNRLLWMQDAYRLTEADRVLQKTPYSFDVSVWEFLWPLLTGARLVVAEPDAHQDSSHLVRLIAAQQITVVHFVPSMLRVLLDEKGLEECRGLRHVICSGEALPVELEKRFHERLGARLHNLYGPTEAAVDVTSWPCTGAHAWPSVPIGRPVANTQIYLLDEEGEPVAVGVPGELHIGGVQLARGYWGRAGLTAEKFVPDRFGGAPGARLYSTGDIARFHADGWIEFLGRADAQVKIRGFRVELGEIENTLARFEKVREAAVVAAEGKDGGKRLSAYLTLAPGATTDIRELRGFLERKLPGYMIPSDFVVLDAFPLTSSGKVDRRRLHAPERQEAGARPAAPCVAPSTPAEEELARMWRELLGLSRVGVDDNFFELGGHSLVLMQLVMRINEAFRVQIPLRAFFDARSIAEMTTVIAAWQMEHEDPAEVALMLDELGNLTPDEVRALLEAENELSA
jgi:amino acid adenylation domain-containing protein